MMSTSFRAEFRQRLATYRTPSPPREAYEPIYTIKSPTTKTEYNISASRKKRKLQRDHTQHVESLPVINGLSKARTKSTENIKNRHAEDRLLPNRRSANYGFSESQSPLDVFATVATSPDLGSGAFQHFEHISTNSQPLFSNGTYHTPGTNGVRHSRSRSGQIPSSEGSKTLLFPYTTIGPLSGKSTHAIPLSDTAVEDAELLLSFAKAAQPWTPENHSTRASATTLVPDSTSDNIHAAKVTPALNGTPDPYNTSSLADDLGLLTKNSTTPKDEQFEGLSTQAPTEMDQRQDTWPAEARPTNHDVPIHGLGVGWITTAPARKSQQVASLPPSESLEDAVHDLQQELTPNSHAQQLQLPVESPVADGLSIKQMHQELGNQSQDTSTTPETRQRIYKGWPKGKPRGPRQVPYAKRGTRRSSKPSTGFKSTDVAGSNATDLFGEGMFITPSASNPGVLLTPSYQFEIGFPVHDRLRCHSTEPLAQKVHPLWSAEYLQRSRSVPPHIPMTIRPAPIPKTTSARSKEPLPKPSESQINLCASCNASKNGTNGYHDVWIACNACGKWYHHICVGFTTEREVRDVDKFYCKACEPKHGTTTFVRKSSRAHAAVDYASLHEGKIRTSTDNPDHHYITSFKDGTRQFQPELFPRMRPEFVTAGYFERCSSFTEPIVIPGWMNNQLASSRDNFDRSEIHVDENPDGSTDPEENGVFSSDFEYDCVHDYGQDKLDMVIPRGLSVRRVADLYGPDERVEVIDVKSQEGGDNRWTMRRWADYYEATGEKPVRNVISLEVSHTKLGRLIQRPKVVRDLDLQDSVWPADEIFKGLAPKVQFYCLMSVANCYTDFHVDFGGSSVYYHIVKGKKTFFFIPPKKQHLKKYEDWCLSSEQGSTFLGDETKECYRVDLSTGDTMLIPSGWIHAVWTPCDSLVIGGNFLTRMHYGMQIQINEVEKNTGVARKFRYPHFQKVMWYAVIRYLENDPLPTTVAQLLINGQSFDRKNPVYLDFDEASSVDVIIPEYHNARYYSQGEIEGLPDLLRYIFRTVLVSLGKVQGVTKTTQESVIRSMPKGYGDYLEIAQTFAMWVAWKRGNEEIPPWAHSDAVIAEEQLVNGEKKISAAAMKRLERQAAHEAFLQGSTRRSSARQAPKDLEADNGTPRSSEAPAAAAAAAVSADVALSKPRGLASTPRRPACDACRKRRIRCKHKGFEGDLPDIKDRFGIRQVVHPVEVNEDNIGALEMKGETISPTDATPSRRSTLITVLIPSPGYNSNVREPTFYDSGAGSQSEHRVMSAEVAGSQMQDTDAMTMSKRARTRACDECRKSKRRCIHDDQGHVDPIKAQEISASKNQQSSKRSRPEADFTRQSQKRVKKGLHGSVVSNVESLSDNTPLEPAESTLPIDPMLFAFTQPSPEPEIELEAPFCEATDLHNVQHSIETPANSEFTIYDPTHPPLAHDVDPSGFVSDDEDELSKDVYVLYRPDMPHLSTLELSNQREHVGIERPVRGHENSDILPVFQGFGPSESENKNALQLGLNEASDANSSSAHEQATEEINVRNSSILLDGLNNHPLAGKATISPVGTAPTTSGGITSPSESLPSTPPMSPLTDLELSVPPESPHGKQQNGSAITIKSESSLSTVILATPTLRQTSRQRNQVDRFSGSSYVTEAKSSASPPVSKRNMPVMQPQIQRVSSRQRSPTTSLDNSTAAMPAPAPAPPSRKRTASRSASREVAAKEIGIAMISTGLKVQTEAERREEEDGRLARELSGLDFGLRRRSR